MCEYLQIIQIVHLLQNEFNVNKSFDNRCFVFRFKLILYLIFIPKHKKNISIIFLLLV